MKELRERNIELIKKYESDAIKLNRQYLIANLLKKDDCFFELKVEDALNLIKDLEYSNVEEIYLKLISYDNYVINRL